MFEQPQLIRCPNGYQIHVRDTQASDLLSALRKKGSSAELTEGEFGVGDLNGNKDREEIRVIELPLETDEVKLSSFLRVRN
jgi:hypothetical protein